MKILTRIAIVLALCILASCAQRQDVNPEITRDELYAHIDFLASDSLMGRQPGTPFDRVAAKYIKDYLGTSGLEMLGKNGYQFFEYIDHQDLGSNNSMSVNKKALELGKDYSVLSFSSSDTLSASVVFVGYGFNLGNTDISWDDYIPVSVNGKWVVILRGDPDYENSESAFAPYSSDRHKAQVAKEQGALGVILVSGVKFDKEDDLVSTKQKSFDIGIPVVQVKRTVANAILKTNGNRVEDIEEKIILDRSPKSFSASANVCVNTDVVTKKKHTQNVVALVEGKHPVLKNQYVVIGAHYDHIGMGGKGSSSRNPDTLAVHNGADDNASGVAVILEIGQKLMANPPHRSVLVVAFGAEELGLLGSRYFTENPLVPTDSIVAMVNIDMIGRLNEERTLQVGGYKTSMEAEAALHRVNQNHNFKLALSPQGYGPSDHASFYSKSIPVFFFTTGPHVDYHTPNDVIELINFDGLVESTELIYDVVTEVANAPIRLTFQEAGPAAPSSRHGRELKVRLGIMPDVSGARNDGLPVLAVTEGQPAFIAGLQRGDIITAMNGKPVNNIQDYMFRLQELNVGSTISLEFKRNDEVKVVLVQL